MQRQPNTHEVSQSITNLELLICMQQRSGEHLSLHVCTHSLTVLMQPLCANWRAQVRAQCMGQDRMAECAQDGRRTWVSVSLQYWISNWSKISWMAMSRSCKGQKHIVS